MLHAAAMAALMILLVGPLVAAAEDPEAVRVSVPHWIDGKWTKSAPTYQTSINPKYRMDGLPGTSNISHVVFENMANLKADYMRHVPWFPYPRLAVAQLEEPRRNSSACTSGWDFSYIDPIMDGLIAAVGDRPIVLNFATIPQWMWVTPAPVTIPSVNVRDVQYEQGTQLRDGSFLEVVSYFKSLARYYTQGGFVDECGVQRISKYNLNITWWEVLNEPEFEHGFSAELYGALYDAIVSELQIVMPNTKFLGLALASHNDFNRYSQFLNRTTHRPNDIPLSGISYHQYVSAGDSIDMRQVAAQYFDGMDHFVDEIKQVESIKHATKEPIESFINEIGCAASNAAVMQQNFYLICAASYSYLFARAAPLQVEHFGMSQVVGFTGESLCSGCEDEWASTSMVNWCSGAGNARYWVLKMMVEEFPFGLKGVPDTQRHGSAAGKVWAQAFNTHPERKVLIVSKTSGSVDITVTNSAGGWVSYVDPTTGDQFGCAQTTQVACYVKRQKLPTDTFTLGAFGTAIVVLPMGSTQIVVV